MPASGSVPDRSTTLRRALDFLGDEGSGSRRPVVLVDDAHRLDEASAGLLLLAAMKGTATVVVTVRIGEVAPDAITTLWKDGYAARMDVQALSAAESRAQAEAIVGARLDDRAAAYLWEMAAGNPLFTREIVLSGRTTGALLDVGGIWVWRAGGIPHDGRLADLVRATVGSVEGELRDLVELLAAGEQVPLATIEALTDPATVMEAARRGLVELRGHEGDVVALSHPLYGEVVRSEMPTEHLRRVRADLARLDVGGVIDRRIRAAWLLDAGVAPDVELFIGAADDANRTCDYERAAELALAVLATTPDPRAIRALAFARNGTGDGAGVSELLQPILDEGAVRGEAAARLALEHSRAMMFAQGRPVDAVAALEAWETLVGDPVWKGVLQGERAGALIAAGCLAEGLDLAEPLLASEQDPRVRVRALGAVGIVLAQNVGPEKVGQLAAELMGPAMAVRLDIPGAPMMVAAVQVMAMAMQGELDAIDRVTSLVLAAYQNADDEVRAMLHGGQAGVLLLRGKVVDAAEVARGAISLLDSAGRTWRVPALLALSAEALARAGDAVQARADIERARAEAPPWDSVTLDLIDRAGLWVTCAEAGTSAAVREADAVARRVRNRWTELLCRHDAVRLGGGIAAARLLVQVASDLDGDMARLAEDQARGMVAADADALEVTSQRFEAKGLLAHAAETSALAAVLADRRGSMQQAVRLRARAEMLFADCQGSRPPLVELVAQGGHRAPPRLTRREREIVELASRGLSNRHIAEQLVVSVRTVEGHMSRALGKLGVSGRDELAGIVGGSSSL